MGLFDTLIIEPDLPPFKTGGRAFQTKSLGQQFRTYRINTSCEVMEEESGHFVFGDCDPCSIPDQEALVYELVIATKEGEPEPTNTLVYYELMFRDGKLATAKYVGTDEKVVDVDLSIALSHQHTDHPVCPECMYETLMKFGSLWFCPRCQKSYADWWLRVLNDEYDFRKPYPGAIAFRDNGTICPRCGKDARAGHAVVSDEEATVRVLITECDYCQQKTVAYAEVYTGDEE